ncbi:MAG: hypothetical protein NWE94_01980 [Candidatus Bathyarchaeota archaeon]|nr:hypothetical protein [Candidatus Bathyarchaeota archaeon]
MHSKLIINRLAAIGVILITVSALMLSFAGAATTRTESSTEFLFSLIQNANATLNSAYCRLNVEGVTIPQKSLSAYEQALLLADEAASQLQAGNFSESNSKAIQALQQFKEALRIVYAAFPEQPTEAEITFEKIATLQSGISRSYVQLQRLENLTAIASEAGFNITLLKAKIEDVKALLANASRSLNQRDFEAALSSAAQAKALINNLLSHVEGIAADLKIQRLAAYVEQTEARLAALRTEASTAQNAASLAALNSAEDSLANAKKYLEKQQISETLTALASSKASEEQAADYLKPSSDTASTSSTTASPTPSPSASTKSPAATPNTSAATR